MRLLFQFLACHGKACSPVTVSGPSSSKVATVPGGYSQYTWGNDINTASVGSNLSVAFTNPIRCYIKDGNNWLVSPSVFKDCPSCREGAGGSADNEKPPITLTVSPNPFAQSFSVEFDVPEEGSYTRLDIVDSNGRVVKVLTDGIHGKGHWTYPVTNTGFEKEGVYFCRIKINEWHTTKKLVHIN